MFWGEIVIGLEIVTLYRVIILIVLFFLYFFNSFNFLNNADVEKCGSFKSFGFIYIYIDYILPKSPIGYFLF